MTPLAENITIAAFFFTWLISFIIIYKKKMRDYEQKTGKKDH